MALSFKQTLRRFVRETNGNVAIIVALTALPMLMLAGIGIDYGIAAMRQEQLSGYADAAALAAVTPTMMAQATSIGATTATNVFTAQASSLKDVSNTSPSVNVTVNGLKRTATVGFAAAYQTSFATILGWKTIPISGSSSATGGIAPNIDFYLMLDDSPSMAIAATQAGIDAMVAATPTQGGCAFGCHQTHPQSDNLGNPGGIDNYQLARNLNVTLRIDMLRQAAQDLASTAASTMATNKATYRMGIYTFDLGLNTIQTLTSDLAAAKTAAGNIDLLTVYANNWLTSSNKNSDTDTSYNVGMASINSTMPDPGGGTSNASDKPQEVLFLVTDGVGDAMISGSRKIGVITTSLCDTIKTRGIRIAVLYTSYLPLPTNGFYNGNVAPFQSNIGPTLQSCASPGLYFQVNTGDDISAALIALFKLAIPSSFLSK
jgi:Flp pilus assembly protein TadG